MSSSENSSPKQKMPTITLGRNVKGCHFGKLKGKYSIKKANGGQIYRVKGMDFQIETSLRQNAGTMRVAIKSILSGTSLNGIEIDLDRLQDVIQRRVHLLLQANCTVTKKNDEAEDEVRESQGSLRAPLVTSKRESSAWNKIALADKMDFNLIRGDQITLRIESIDFIDVQSYSTLEFS